VDIRYIVITETQALYQHKSQEAKMPQLQIALPFLRGGNVLARVLTVVRVAAQRRRERRQLAALDQHLLRDIGLDAQTAESECSKPFWKP
jgi:uncharacterized protein YjiS (DUF1127 family)